MYRFYVLLASLAAMLLAGGLWARYEYANAPLAFRELPLRVTIPKGAGARAAALALRKQGVDVPERLFRAAARLRGDASRLKSGTYRFTEATTLATLIDRMVAGDVMLAEIRFIEGWTFAQFRAAIAAHEELRQDSADLEPRELLTRIGATETEPEGLFFPSTYSFSPGSSDFDVLRGAYRKMKETLQSAWESRAADLPLASPYEALVLASIIEKETGSDGDRGRVAAVFVNRLRKGMMLQSDPTVIYGLGEKFDGNLRRRDLRTDTPYNTYTRTGLTPTPIANPGTDSIRAALNPADTQDLYFVSRGDGTSEFSQTLAQHNRAVARYQLRQRR